MIYTELDPHPVGGVQREKTVTKKKKQRRERHRDSEDIERRINMQADKSEITKLLKTARGQINGILKMVEEDRYCIDISRQLMATEAVINTANRKVLTEHLKGCVKAAETDEEKDEKIEEMVKILGKIIK